MKYREAFKRWDQDFGRIGKRPEMPEIPAYLEIWLELRRWPGHLLVEGGLWDQPSWTWEMVDLAGTVYQSVVGGNNELG